VLTPHLSDLDAHHRDIHEVMRVGNYYISSDSGANSTNVLVAGQMYASPIVVARDITVDRIAIQVTLLAAGSSARLGIHNDGVDLYPGSLLLDAGVVGTAANGMASIVIDQALTKGLYWLTLIGDDTPTVRSYIPAEAVLGFEAGVNAFNNKSGYWQVAQAFGALPDPFTAGGSQKVGTTIAVGLR
ncbi:unnamed protein product, partial [marine sediment metagenome]